MKRRSKLLIWCLLLCLGGALAAQEATPESKSEPARKPTRIRVSQGVSEGLIVKKVQPDYPQLARTARIQGDVVLKVSISPEGEVSTANLISGHPMLAAAAITAVKQWRYKPYLLNGEPLAVETQVTVAFRLDTSEGAAGGAKADLPAAATGVAGDVPGGIPDGQTGSAINGIISSVPATMPRVAAPQRVRVSAGVSTGLLMKKVNPEYPAEARRGRIQGTVLMHAIISKTGDITTLELVSGHPMLAPAALEAVKQWKYKPYLLNGQAVEVDTEIQVNFTLSEN
jgi:TonB family protein